MSAGYHGGRRLYRRPGPWLEALRLYHERGYSARAICDLLNEGLHLYRELELAGHSITFVQRRKMGVIIEPPLLVSRSLPPQQRLRLQAMKEQARELAEVLACLCREAARNLLAGYWTTRQVKHHLRQQRQAGLLGKRRHRNPLEAGRTLAGQRDLGRQDYVARKGWGHLLPPDGEPCPPRPPPQQRPVRLSLSEQEPLEQPEPVWEPKLDLTVREADILSLLEERGCLTAYQIRDALPRRLGEGDGLRQKPRRELKRLLLVGIVEVLEVRRVKPRGRTFFVYSLTKEACPHARSKQPDGLELREKRRKHAECSKVAE